jgi:hypothetical protein
MSASNPYGVNGADVLVLVNGIVVGGQRGARITKATGFVDFSSKSSVNERGRPGRLSSTLSLDSLYVVSDSGQASLRTARDNRDMITLRIKELGTDVQTADAVCTSLECDYPDQAESLHNAEFQVSDGWTNLP